MKRILIFSLAYYPHVSGAEMAIKEITDRISDIEFHMVTMRWSNDELFEEKIGNVRVFRIDCGRGRLAKAWFQIAALLKARALHMQHHYDVIWAMMAHSAGVPAGLFKTFSSKTGYVLTLQEGDPPEYVERVMAPFGPLFNWAFTKADVLQPISTFLDVWGKKMGFVGSSVIIPNGVDTVLFAGEPQPHQGTVLITTSRLVEKNAVDDVIRALPALPDARFVVIGIGPDEAMLKALVKELGVADRVEFVGFVQSAEIPAWLHAADVFIRPSRSEGMGNSFVEAMAAGLPVIATQEGGIADFLFDAKRNPDMPTTGWAVDKDSPEQIADAVKDIMAHPDKVRSVTATAKAMVVEKYDWNLIARDMREKVFARVLP